MASTDVNVKAFGRAFSLHLVDYDGAATTFLVDASARAGAAVAPASGPTVTIGSANSGSPSSSTPRGTKTVTLAAAGQHTGGKVVVVIWHGGSVSPAGARGDGV